MGEVLSSGTYFEQHSIDGFTLFCDIRRAEFYRVLLDPLSNAKFARVNDDLYRRLHEFNKKETENISKRGKQKHGKFSPKLANSKQAKKYLGKTDEEVLIRERKKPLEEIGILGGVQRDFSSAVVAYSKKKLNRILGFGYISDIEKPRIYVRNSTLCEYPIRAEEVIRAIRKELNLGGIESILVLPDIREFHVIERKVPD